VVVAVPVAVVYCSVCKEKMNVWSFSMVAQMWRVCLLGRLGTVGSCRCRCSVLYVKEKMNVWSFSMVAQMWRVCLLGRLGTVGGLC
jgi:hypothetical protein